MADIRRAFFRCDNADGSNLVIDLVLGADRRCLPRVPEMGYWGRIGSDNIWPFVLRQSKLMDFGATAGEHIDPIVRFGEFSLDGRIIAVGEAFELYYQEPYSMVLDKLTDVSEVL